MASEPSGGHFDDIGDDIGLPNGPLRFVSEASRDAVTADYERVAAKLAALAAERDATIGVLAAALEGSGLSPADGGTLLSLANTLQDWCDGLEAERDAALRRRDHWRDLAQRFVTDRATLLEAIDQVRGAVISGRASLATRAFSEAAALFSAASKIRERTTDA